MPKKTGLATATRLAVDPEKWVTETTPPSIPTGPIARMTVELPLDLHRELKGACGRQGLKIKRVIIALVQEYLAGNIKLTESQLR
jgi:hypothetical protein